MSEFKELNLEFNKFRNIRINETFLEPIKDEVNDFVCTNNYMNNLKFAKKLLMNQEIKANNTIEGINDDLSFIDEIILKKGKPDNEQKQRIINVYKGYKYILRNRIIDKDHLKDLYAILSSELLNLHDRTNMGEYYRNGPVYIMKSARLDGEYYMGLDEDKLDYYMDQLFEFINNDIFTDSKIDVFIKSQIMHFYFVYIHPYFDVNGRTSRTLSLWYLLNNKSYPYIIFNRAIAFNKREYEENIIKGRSYGDITLFLNYLLLSVKKELEKECVMHSISENISYELTSEEYQILDYFMAMKGQMTIKDLAATYNLYNDSTKPLMIYNNLIAPLIDKGVFIRGRETKGFINGDLHNMYISLNDKNIDIDREKIKRLDLGLYIKK